MKNFNVALALFGALSLCACSADESPDKPTPSQDQGHNSQDMRAQDQAPDADMPKDLGPQLEPYPAPDAWEPNRGPGGPKATFSQEQLYEHCAYLDGGPNDLDHHNMVAMYDGYLMMPWATEASRGGVAFFDISDPCSPTRISNVEERTLRESHSIGFSSQGGRWAVLNSLTRIKVGGVQFWDIADTSAPKLVSTLDLPGFAYPDAYKRVTLSVFWQAPYVYVAGANNGVYIIDASDPTQPKHIATYPFDPVMQAGQIHAVGDLLIVTSAGQSRTVLLDISDPASPQPIPGADFDIKSGDGEALQAYFSNISQGRIYYARKSNGGGLVVYDIQDPSAPTYLADYHSDGNGGYVFVKDNLAFTGESNFAAIYDISDLGNIAEVKRMNLTGDLDTATPIGNVVVLASDDKSDDGKASAIVPYALEPDTTPPKVNWVWPKDGATGLRTTSRVGVTLSEMIDIKSAFEGSVRLYESAHADEPARGRVFGVVSAQENVVNFWPSAPLKPNTSYTLEIVPGGLIDYNGNAITERFSATFTTGAN